jgi:hypothetical protein
MRAPRVLVLVGLCAANCYVGRSGSPRLQSTHLAARASTTVAGRHDSPKMTRNVTRVAERTFRSVKQSVAKYLMHDLVKESGRQRHHHNSCAPNASLTPQRAQSRRHFHTCAQERHTTSTSCSLVLPHGYRWPPSCTISGLASATPNPTSERIEPSGILRFSEGARQRSTCFSALATHLASSPWRD